MKLWLQIDKPVCKIFSDFKIFCIETSFSTFQWYDVMNKYLLVQQRKSNSTSPHSFITTLWWYNIFCRTSCIRQTTSLISEEIFYNIWYFKHILLFKKTKVKLNNLDSFLPLHILQNTQFYMIIDKYLCTYIYFEQFIISIVVTLYLMKQFLFVCFSVNLCL